MRGVSRPQGPLCHRHLRFVDLGYRPCSSPVLKLAQSTNDCLPSPHYRLQHCPLRLPHTRNDGLPIRRLPSRTDSQVPRAMIKQHQHQRLQHPQRQRLHRHHRHLHPHQRRQQAVVKKSLLEANSTYMATSGRTLLTLPFKDSMSFRIACLASTNI